MRNVMDMFRLDGKVAVVTGGCGRYTSGMKAYGNQMVYALAQAGAKVCVTTSKPKEAIQGFVDDCVKEGYDVFAEHLDQGSEESINEFLATMQEKCGKIDILVNNAVSRGGKGDEDWEGLCNSLRVNGVGLQILSIKVGKMMEANGGGSIINIGSYMGILGGNDTLYKGTNMAQVHDMSSDYYFHKGGMTNLTRFLAAKFGPGGVRVNVLELGGLSNIQIQHPMFVERYNDCTFLKRMANETDLMGAIVWLASDASEYVTGTVIPIDGGYSAK